MKCIGYDIQGVNPGGKIIFNPEAGIKTLIHELAHEILHHAGNAPLDRTIRELEAESVAYVVTRHFGLDGLASPNYVALHGATADLILEHLERIRTIAAKIIRDASYFFYCKHMDRPQYLMRPRQNRQVAKIRESLELMRNERRKIGHRGN